MLHCRQFIDFHFGDNLPWLSVDQHPSRWGVNRLKRCQSGVNQAAHAAFWPTLWIFSRAIMVSWGVIYGRLYPKHDHPDPRVTTKHFFLKRTHKNTYNMQGHTSIHKVSFRTSWSFLDIWPLKSLNWLQNLF